MCDNFSIKANMKDIDFYGWHSLGNDCYYLIVIDYSKYTKLMKNLAWWYLQYIYDSCGQCKFKE